MRREPLHRRSHAPLIALAIASLAGCANLGNHPATTARSEEVLPPYKGGGYYKDDGPGRKVPANLDQIPNAVPKEESLITRANVPYSVLGKEYRPLPPSEHYKEHGLASWYGRKFHGKKTSSGEPYDMYAMTAAHATLPIPSYARVTNLDNGQSVVVRVNDRGPFHKGRIIDLSYTAAYKLDVLKGVTPVEVELVSADAAPDSFIAQAAPDVAPAPAAAPVKLAAASDVPEGIYLQLGAFANPDSAAALSYRASNSFPHDFPAVTRLDNGGLHKVQAGPFPSIADAERAATQIREKLDVQPIKILAKSVATHGLYLQLAALSSSAAAQDLKTRVQARYGDSLPGIDQVTAGKLTKVQAGPFADAAAAERLALAYQQDFGAKPYKVQR